MLHLIGDYYLTADPNCYIIGKPTQRGANRIEMRQARYFTALPAAVSAAANLAVREGISSGEVTSLQDAVTQMQRVSDKLKAAVSGMQQ